MRSRFRGNKQVPANDGDTAGVPWQGRSLHPTGFEDDTGAADAALQELLAQPASERDPATLTAAVATARLMVPIVARSPSDGQSSSEMASVTIQAADGTRALPVFSSAPALTAWHSGARPVPVAAQRAAAAALQEDCQAMLVDLPAPPGDPAAVLSQSMLWALAEGRTWLPPDRDPVVQEVVRTALTAEPEVRQAALGTAYQPAGATLQLSLTLAPGLTKERVQQLVTGIGQRVAGEERVRIRIDGIAFELQAG